MNRLMIVIVFTLFLSPSIASADIYLKVKYGACEFKPVEKVIHVPDQTWFNHDIGSFIARDVHLYVSKIPSYGAYQYTRVCLKSTHRVDGVIVGGSGLHI